MHFQFIFIRFEDPLADDNVNAHCVWKLVLQNDQFQSPSSFSSNSNNTCDETHRIQEMMNPERQFCFMSLSQRESATTLCILRIIIKSGNFQKFSDFHIN
jgi:hypothetical protein